MSCLDAHISLESLPIEVSVGEDSMRLDVGISLLSSNVFGEIQDLSKHIDAKISLLGGVLPFSIVEVCGVDLSWEEFWVSGMVFIDKNGENIIVKRNNV